MKLDRFHRMPKVLKVVLALLTVGVLGIVFMAGLLLMVLSVARGEAQALEAQGITVPKRSVSQ